MKLIHYEHVYDTNQYAYTIGRELCQYAICVDPLVVGVCNSPCFSNNTQVTVYAGKNIFGFGSIGTIMNSSFGAIQ